MTARTAQVRLTAQLLLLLQGRREVGAVERALGRGIDRTQHVPGRIDQGVDHGAVDVRVGVERETASHYLAVRRYSALLRSCSSSQPSSSASSASMSFWFS